MPSSQQGRFGGTMGKASTVVAGVALVVALGATGVAVAALQREGPRGPQGQAGQQGDPGPPGPAGAGLSVPQTYGNATLARNYRRYVLAVWCGPNGARYVATVTTDDGTQLQVCDAE